MKKLIFMGLIVAVMCASEKEGIYDYFHKNGDIPRKDGTTFRQNLDPSFDCAKESSKESKVAEEAICNSPFWNLMVDPDIKYIYPTLVYLDNLFSSYYKLIMQHTPKDKRQEVKKIAREAMKQRNRVAMCNKNALSRAARWMCINDGVAISYAYGIRELTQYLSINNPKLLDSIFSQYAKEIGNIKFDGDYKAELLDKLYKDNIIDETGKLVVKVDSKW